MLLRKRRINKYSPKKGFKILLITILFIGLITTFFSYLYINFYINTYGFISPLSQTKESLLARVEEELEKQNISFGKVTSNSDGSLTVKLRDDSEIIFSSKKNVSSQITSLQLMLSRLTIEGKKLKSLDFRFDNPVVSFK
ncbi:MAG: hypothetical protein HY344_04595 [Candidatus Levybacteria bacterium]|nr:hypothetical protein [Candidatus Levybacteria bacterium]